MYISWNLIDNMLLTWVAEPTSSGTIEPGLTTTLLNSLLFDLKLSTSATGHVIKLLPVFLSYCIVLGIGCFSK